MTTTDTQFDLVGAIMAFEEGEASEQEVLALFQHLVDTGMAWSLQGSYGRTAEHLIREGHITAPAETVAMLDRRRAAMRGHVDMDAVLRRAGLL